MGFGFSGGVLKVKENIIQQSIIVLKLVKVERIFARQGIQLNRIRNLEFSFLINLTKKRCSNNIKIKHWNY